MTKTLDVTLWSGVVFSTSGSSCILTGSTGNVDPGTNPQTVTTLGQDAYCKFTYYAGPGTSGNPVGTLSFKFVINANTNGTVTVTPTIPVYCQ